MFLVHRSELTTKVNLEVYQSNIAQKNIKIIDIIILDVAQFITFT